MSGLYSGMSPREIVPGDPSELNWLAGQLATLSNGLGTAAAEINRINAGSWQGEAAQAFHNRVRQQPQKYSDAADAFGLAANAISVYAQAVEGAQALAARAITQYEDAQGATQAWSSRRNQAQSQHRADPTKPMPNLGSDPGASGRASAENLAATAQADVEVAARRAQGMLHDAASRAPHQPSLLSRFIHGVEHVAKEVVRLDIKAITAYLHFEEILGHTEILLLKQIVTGQFAGEFVKGAWAGTKGLGQGIVLLARIGWDISPMRAEIDPEGWAKTMRDASTGLASGVNFAIHHPAQFASIVGKTGEAMLNWDEFQKDPARWLGELAPTVAITLATAGVGGAAARAADSADELSVAGAEAFVNEGDLSTMIANAQQAQRYDQVADALRAIKQASNLANNLDTAGNIVQVVGSGGKDQQDIAGGWAAGKATDDLIDARFVKP